MRIALAQFNPTVGDFAGNAARILSLAGQAKLRGADLAVFTELCLCGYPPQDLLERPAFLDRNIDELKELAQVLVSKCAEFEPSLDTAVHLSFNTTASGRPAFTMGSTASTIPGFSLGFSPRRST